MMKSRSSCNAEEAVLEAPRKPRTRLSTVTPDLKRHTNRYPPSSVYCEIWILMKLTVEFDHDA